MTSYPTPDPVFTGMVKAHAKIVDLVTDAVVSETDLVLDGEVAWVLDQVGNMMATIPMGEPGTGTDPFSYAMIAAGGGPTGTGIPKAYILGLSLDGGLSYDSWKLLEHPERRIDPGKMVLIETGNDLWGVYANTIIRRTIMRNILFEDAISGVSGTIASLPFATVPLGYDEGSGIISASGILPGAQGLLTYKPVAKRRWAGAHRLSFSANIDSGTTTPIGGGQALDLAKLSVSLDTNHDSVAKAMGTVLLALAGVEGSGFRGHYVADCSDASLNMAGIANSISIGHMPDSGLTFVSANLGGTYGSAPDSLETGAREGVLGTARIVDALSVTPQLDQRYWSATILGGNSDAELPGGATITGMAVIPPNIPLFGVYVNPGIGGVYTTLGDERAIKVSPQFGVHDMQVRHPTQVVYAATDGGVYSGSTISSALLGGQKWDRVGGLLGGVSKLQLLGHFQANWTTIDYAPAVNQPSIPSSPGLTYEATYAFYSGDASGFRTRIISDSRFSLGSGTYPTTHSAQYNKVLAAGGTFYTGMLPVPPKPSDVTSPPAAKPPVSPTIPPGTATAHSRAVVNPVFALVSGSSGGDGLYMYPGVQDVVAGQPVLGNNLTYDGAGHLVGVDYTDALSQLSGHSGWDKLINGACADFGMCADGTQIWIEQVGATQILRADGRGNVNVILLPSGTGVNKIITSPQVPNGAWIVPTGGLEALYWLPQGMSSTLVPLDTDISLSQPSGTPVAVSGLTSIRDTINGQFVDNVVLTSTGFYWNERPGGGGWRLGTGQGGLETTNLLYMVSGTPFSPTDRQDITISPFYATDGSAIYVSNNGGINWRKLGGESLDLGPFFFDAYAAKHGGAFPPYNPFTLAELRLDADDLNAANPGTRYQWVRSLDNTYQFVYTLEETNSTAVYEYSTAVSNLATNQNVRSTLASDQLATVHKRWLVEHQRALTQFTVSSYFDDPAHKLRVLRPGMKVTINFTGTIPNDRGTVTYVDFRGAQFYVLSHTVRVGGLKAGATTTTLLCSELQKNRLTPDQMVADLAQLSKDIVLRSGH